MRAHSTRGTIAAIILTAMMAGCGDAPPATQAVAGTAKAGPSVPGDIDAAKALALLFGPYDAKANAARWERRASHQGKAGDSPAEAMLVTTLLAERVREGDTERFYLASAAIPDHSEEPFDCEGCAPSVGLSVFVRRGAQWVLETHAPEVFDAGMNGRAPGARLVETGAARHDVLFEWEFGNRGVAESYAVLVGAAATGVRELLRLRTASENSGDCGEGTAMEAPCYGWEMKLDFVPGNPGEPYEVRAQGKGSSVDFAAEERKARPFSGTAVYRFKGERYVLTSSPENWPQP